MRNARYTVEHYLLNKYLDDGPPAIDQIVEACRILSAALKSDSCLTVFCPEGTQSHERNSALCIAAFSALVKELSSQDAMKPWVSNGTEINFLSHCWAPIKKAPPPRGLLFDDCLNALLFAKKNRWLDMDSFDSAAYKRTWDKYDAIWMVPGEILLMADPMSTVTDPNPVTEKLLLPDPAQKESSSFISFFKGANIQLIIRLNFGTEPGLEKGTYAVNSLEAHDIEVLDIPFEDLNGGVPPVSLIKRALAKCNEVAPCKQDGHSDGAIAFHCKSGFGRSVVMATLLLVQRFDLPGRLALAWARMCRPGAITTLDQAKFLQKIQGAADLEVLLSKTGCCTLSKTGCCTLL